MAQQHCTDCHHPVVVLHDKQPVPFYVAWWGTERWKKDLLGGIETNLGTMSLWGSCLVWISTLTRRTPDARSVSRPKQHITDLVSEALLLQWVVASRRAGAIGTLTFPKNIFFMMLVFGKTKLDTFLKAEFSDKFLLWSKMFEGLKWMKAGFVIFSSEFHRWQRDWKSRIAFFLSIHLQNPSPTPSLHQQHDGDYHLDCGGIVGNWWGRSQARSPTFPSHCSVLLLLHILFHPFRHRVYHHHHHCWICLPEYNFTKV